MKTIMPIVLIALASATFASNRVCSVQNVPREEDAFVVGLASSMESVRPQGYCTETVKRS